MRRYEQTHPWISFSLDLNSLTYETWLLLGEAASKADHIAGTPLRPDVARALNGVYLTKGVHATTQIEGNTLTEEQVGRRIDHDLDLPKSQEYLGREVDNVLAAYHLIDGDVSGGKPLDVALERITQFNRIVLEGLPYAESPGVVRTESVVVADYRGAPAEDCAYLLDQLCQWLNDLCSVSEPILRKPVAILAAALAHLYIAWIHPFVDGNGRTARLVEYQVLIQAGFPTASAHVMADHYNLTRAEYYRQLAATTRKEPYSAIGFLNYALQGLVDGLREQIDRIREQHFEVTWEIVVHAHFQGQGTIAGIRRRDLLLALAPGEATPVRGLRGLTPHLAACYADKQDKTITRDVNALLELGLVVRTPDRKAIRPRVELITGFLPLIDHSKDDLPHER